MMKKWAVNVVFPLTERVLSLGLALIWLRSAFAHLANPYFFLSTIYSYRLTSIISGQWVAIIIPWLQIIISICLVMRWWLPSAFALSAALFLSFGVAQLFVLERGLEISCGCFGAANSVRVGWATLTTIGVGMFASLLGVSMSAAHRLSGPISHGRGCNP